MSYVKSLGMAVLLMGLAWPLRGQFGHLKGALIPGALAAVIVALAAPRPVRGQSFGLAVLLGGIGFSLGGHLSYGPLIEEILARPSLGASLSEFATLFFVGALWGGLGMSFLSFAVDRATLRERDLLLLLTLGLFWWIVLGLLNWEDYDLTLYTLGFWVLLTYNFLVKKSKAVSYFSLLGFLGFGTAFVLAVLILFWGETGVFGNTWPWWRLRDQIIGVLGGIAVWLGFQVSQKAFSLAASREASDFLRRAQKWGFLFYLVYIPAVNTSNALGGFEKGISVIHAYLVRGALTLLLGLTAVILLRLFSVKPSLLERPNVARTLVYSTVIFVWYLSAAAIGKSLAACGLGCWEPAFTLFLASDILLTAGFFSIILLEK